MAILRTRASFKQIKAVGGDKIMDANGNEFLEAEVVDGAENYISIKNAATGNAPVISGKGGDDDVELVLQSKGDSAVVVKSNSQNGIFEVRTTQNGGFQLKPTSGTNLYSMVMPSTLPGSDAFMKISASGSVSFSTGSPSSFDVVSGATTSNISANDKLVFQGTSFEIETALSNADTTATLTIGLPNNVVISSALSVPAITTTGGSSIATFSGLNTTFAGNVTVSGDLSVQNLTVNGTTTTVHSTVVTVEDKDIIVAASAQNTAQAVGGGILVGGTGLSATYASWVFQSVGGTSSWESSLPINLKEAADYISIDGTKVLDAAGAYFNNEGLGYGLKADTNSRARLDIKKDDTDINAHQSTTTKGSVSCREISLNSTGSGFGTENTLLQVYLNGILQRGVTVGSVGTKLSNGSVDFAYELAAGNVPKVFIPNSEVSNADLLTVYYVV
jgi:hypothetical protein